MMNCPNCGRELRDGTVICPRCGHSIYFALKATRLSDVFYNKGLRCAKNDNMTDAVTALQKSVTFNKKNIAARNLLGLVYYNIGLVSDALKHWILSVSTEKGNNPARKYLDAFQRDQQQLERFADSLRMYNLSLAYLKQKSEDMAIIQLKKAIELNENFVDAMNLLCLCYFVSKQKSKALPLVENALRIDSGSVVAVNYYKELTKGKNPMPGSSSAGTLSRANVQGDLRYGPHDLVSSKTLLASENKKQFPLAQLACFAAGAIILFFIMLFYVMPLSVNQEKEKQYEIELNFSEYKKMAIEERDELNADKEGLTAERDDLTSRNDKLKRENEARDTVLKASKLYFEGNTSEAEALLVGINTENLTMEQIELVNKMSGVATPAPASTDSPEE